jgi:predicted regulator of Ras-like GTPase activity (Roadblock/LC7/MglB family)
MPDKLIEKSKKYLQGIKSVPGVENVILLQRDGYPITSSGVWFSEDEIFGVSASAAAILSVAQRLHHDLLYILIEGERNKFLLATLPRASDYFLMVTTQNHVNLGAMLLQLEKTTIYLDKLLWKENFTTPLRAFEHTERQAISKAFDVHSHVQSPLSTGTLNITITQNAASQINAIVDEFLATIPSARTGIVCLEGGYLIPTQHFSEGSALRETTLTYTLFDTSRKVAQLVKRTGVVQVLCDCKREQHFIYRLEGGLFSTAISKDTAKLGLLRLVIPNFISEIETVLQRPPPTRRPTLDVDGLLEAIAR